MKFVCSTSISINTKCNCGINTGASEVNRTCASEAYFINLNISGFAIQSPFLITLATIHTHDKTYDNSIQMKTKF